MIVDRIKKVLKVGDNMTYCDESIKYIKTLIYL